MEETKINHWKKNLDANFISGEDLHDSIKGLKPEMIVTFSREQDKKAYDRNQNAEKIVTGIFLCDISGKELPKPLVMNKTNGRILEKEFGTPDMNKWTKDKTFTLYCQADKRFGWVARLKSYSKKEIKIGDANFEACKKAYVASPAILDTIRKKYNLTAEVEAALTKVVEGGKGEK